jgi:hypothetical protein
MRPRWAGRSRRTLVLFGVMLVVAGCYTALNLLLWSPRGAPLLSPHSPETRADVLSSVAGVCVPSSSDQFSSVACIDDGDKTFVGSAKVYGFQIVNRSCMYTNIAFDPDVNKFIFFAKDTPTNRKRHAEGTLLPPVNLASRPYDLPIRPAKQSVIKRKIKWTYYFAPDVQWGPIPCNLPRDPRLLGYYVPIVAPWNYAHTLFCDLFSLFWQMYEHGLLPLLDLQVVAVSAHYHAEFPLPNTNKAFDLFSTRRPIYDVSLPRAVYPALLAGSGTKSWSWVTAEYSASGSSALWYSFRQHIINVTGAVDRNAQSSTNPLRVSICHKRDKRGVLNYNETVSSLETAFPDRRAVQFVLEGAVGRSAREQVQMMIDADVYMCNEGTLATSFFLMPPGSVFISLPLVYHGPHLHQRHMPRPDEWWKAPDMMRPDPRRNTGGNIDWFPPSIRWIRTFWYDQIPLNETRIQLPLVHLRNYMPDFNIVISARRIVPLMQRVLGFLAAGRPGGPWRISSLPGGGKIIEEVRPKDMPRDPEDLPHLTSSSGVGGGASQRRPPNYSITADICRQMLQKAPHWTKAFNSARCFYGMSWLCEFWANTQIRWRLLHEKWSLSHGRCGDRATTLQYNPDIADVRLVTRALGEYLFYSREELAASYTTLDLGKFNASPEELDQVFAPSPEGQKEKKKSGDSRPASGS